jgi:hypothetical protein
MEMLHVRLRRCVEKKKREEERGGNHTVRVRESGLGGQVRLTGNPQVRVLVIHATGVLCTD